MSEILITSNSPGEVASWVRVTVPHLRRLAPEVRLRVALVPCPYASGAEKRVVETMMEVDEVLSPWETTRLAWSARPRYDKGVVLFLGGDPWHALLLGKRLGYRVAGYFDRPNFWTRRFDLLLFRQDCGQGVYVGDLMVDGLSSDRPRRLEEIGLEPGRPVLGLFPGSRPWHLRVTAAAYLAVADQLVRARPLVDGKPWLQFVMMRSPFVDTRGLQAAIDRPWPLGVPVHRAHVSDSELLSETGLRIPLVSGVPGETFPLFDFAMTIPGTNTAEMACLAKPFLVVLHGRAWVGGGVLAQLVESLPFPTGWKVAMRKRKHAKLRVLALPNRIADRMVAPEVVVGKDTSNLEQELIRWMEDEPGREQLGHQLRDIMGRPGAAQRLAEAVVDFLGKL